MVDSPLVVGRFFTRAVPRTGTSAPALRTSKSARACRLAVQAQRLTYKGEGEGGRGVYSTAIIDYQRKTKDRGPLRDSLRGNHDITICTQ